MQTLLDQMNNLYKTLAEKEAEVVADLDGTNPGFRLSNIPNTTP